MSAAENVPRTRDPNLGKVVLYQLSYFRLFFEQALFPAALGINYTFCAHLHGNSAKFVQHISLDGVNFVIPAGFKPTTF